MKDPRGARKKVHFNDVDGLHVVGISPGPSILKLRTDTQFVVGDVLRARQTGLARFSRNGSTYVGPTYALTGEDGHVEVPDYPHKSVGPFVQPAPPKRKHGLA